MVVTPASIVPVPWAKPAISYSMFQEVCGTASVQPNSVDVKLKLFAVSIVGAKQLGASSNVTSSIAISSVKSPVTVSENIKRACTSPVIVKVLKSSILSSHPTVLVLKVPIVFQAAPSHTSTTRLELALPWLSLIS